MNGLPAQRNYQERQLPSALKTQPRYGPFSFQGVFAARRKFAVGLGAHHWDQAKTRDRSFHLKSAASSSKRRRSRESCNRGHVGPGNFAIRQQDRKSVV